MGSVVRRCHERRLMDPGVDGKTPERADWHIAYRCPLNSGNFYPQWQADLRVASGEAQVTEPLLQVGEQGLQQAAKQQAAKQPSSAG